MNYRHDYHAGNAADVHKHLIVSLIVAHLKQKNTPFFVLDTHGGSGIYDLQADAARRTAEADVGVLRILQQADIPPVFDLWAHVNRGLNRHDPLRYYAGSPELVRQMLRPQDRLAVCELHPQDVRHLKRAMGHDNRVAVHHRDGYEAIPALLPPTQKRGLVLIDPPYETGKDFDRMRAALSVALHRWRNGIFALWYPIKDDESVRRFHADLTTALNLPEHLISTLVLSPPDAPGLRGSGMLVLNPPWTLQGQLDAALPWLQRVLTQ